MDSRPTDQWRAAGTRRSADVLDRTDDSLQAFEAELASSPNPADPQVWAAVGRVVRALNTVHSAGADFDTLDREDLCEYIDRALTEAGVDVDALAARRRIDPAEITDEWRDW